MSARANAYLASLLFVAGSGLLLPSVGWAASGSAAPQSSGGGGITGTLPTSQHVSNAGTTGAVVQPGNLIVSASGNGITVAARASALLRNQLRFTGSVPGSAAGDTIEIERLGRQTGWAWVPTAHGVARNDGSFSAVWPTNHIGRFQIRAVIEGQGGAISRAGAASPTVTVTVYRQAIATYYGAGFYGSTTACGETLKPHTLGVANRTLTCGTKVAIYYQGRTLVVPVIDRGPYANNADWDLTEATARALGITSTVTIGAVSLPTR